VRGLKFYAAHFPNCLRDRSQLPAPFLTTGTSHGVEIVLQDAHTGRAVGWDADLNVATATPSSLLMLPAGNASGNPVGGYYWLVDATSNRPLYVANGWTLAAGDSFELEKFSPFRVYAANVHTFDLVDPTTRRNLRWDNDSMRVEPYTEKATGAWKLRRYHRVTYGLLFCIPMTVARLPGRVSNTPCPYWSSVVWRMRYGIACATCGAQRLLLFQRPHPLVQE